MLFDPVKSLYYFQIYKMFFGVVFVLYFKHLIVLHKPVLRVKPPKLKSKVLTACPPRAKNQYTKGSFKKIRKLIYRKINNFRFCNAQTPETQEKRDVYNVILKLENETLCCLKKNFFFLTKVVFPIFLTRQFQIRAKPHKTTGQALLQRYVLLAH